MKRLQDSPDQVFARLALRAEAEAWQPEEAFDWSRPIVTSLLWPRGLERRLLAQLRHGEAATGALCRRLCHEIPGQGAARFLAAQAADEARHAAAYAAYAARMGEEGAPDADLDEIFRAASSWSGHPLALVLAFNVVIEGEAPPRLSAAARLNASR